MSVRPLSPTVWASPQLAPEALAALAAAGVRRIVSNRPDGEEPGQPTAAEMEQAARDAGMAFAWIPVTGLPQAAQVSARPENRGVWVRPFRDLVYTMPPYVTSDDDLALLTSGLVGAVEAVHG